MARLRSPMTGLVLVILASWAGLVLWQLDAGAEHAGSASGAMLGMRMAAPVGTTPAGSVRAGLMSLPMWVVMCVAMMGPVALPTLRQQWVRTNARRAVAGMAIVQLAMWTTFGAVALVAVGWASVDTERALGLMLLLAAGWELTVPKRRALGAARVSTPLPPGPGAHGARVRWIARGAGACLGSCWALMLVMAVAQVHQMLIWMPLLTAIATAESLGRRPWISVRVAGVALAVAAAVVLAA